MASRSDIVCAAVDIAAVITHRGYGGKPHVDEVWDEIQEYFSDRGDNPFPVTPDERMAIANYLLNEITWPSNE